MFRLRFSFTVLLAALFCASSAQAQEKVELRLRLEKGQTFDQVIALNQKISQTITGKRVEISNQMRFGLRLEVLDLTPSQDYKVKTTYRTVRFSSTSSGAGAPAVKLSYDSAKPPKTIPAGAQPIAALVGQSMIVTVTPTGKILKVEGIEKMVERMVAAMKLPAAQRSKTMQDLQKAIGNSTKQSSGFSPLPAAAIAVGQSWQDKNTISDFAPLIVSTRYTLSAFENDVARVKMQSKITPNLKAAPTVISNVRISYKLAGTQSGALTIDGATGLTRDGEINQRISGPVSMKTITGPKTSQSQSWMMYLKTDVQIQTTSVSR